MNSLTIAGRIGQSELKTVNGKSCLAFSVADDVGYGDKKHTIWWNCSLWEKRAESLAEYLVKGTSVTVVGSISERSWTDKNGNERKSMDVRVNEISMQSRKQDAEKPAEKPASRTADRSQPHKDAFGMDDEVPF